MFPLEGAIVFLRQLAALGWIEQLLSLAFSFSLCVLVLFVAYRIGRRNTADLKDENDALKKKAAASDRRRKELHKEKTKLRNVIDNLQAQRPEERLAHAAREREHGNEEIAIRIYQETLATFGPDLARCCEALAAEDMTERERFQMLATQLAGIGALR